VTVADAVHIFHNWYRQ